MRSPITHPVEDLPAAAASADADALVQALNALLAPLAQLAVAKGMPCTVVEELLRQAFVRAARDAHPNLPSHRAVSRIATATGLNRREVTRLTQAAAAPARRRPLAAEVFARWASDPLYRDARGRPLKLPRQGEAPSFETLAQSVTRDVHPRSLLDELLRLGLAAVDSGDDSDRARAGRVRAARRRRTHARASSATTSVTIWVPRSPTCWTTGAGISNRRCSPTSCRCSPLPPRAN